MNYLKQFLIILSLSFIGEVLKMVLPLPIPASIYGMVLLFALLMSGLLKLDDVKETGKFLIAIMPVMFIPAGVGLIPAWEVLRPLLLPVLIITVVSLLLVMVVSGHVTQAIILHDRRSCVAAPVGGSTTVPISATTTVPASTAAADRTDKTNKEDKL